MSFLIDWIIQLNNQLLLAALISFFQNYIQAPVLNHIHGRIEDAGYYTVDECKQFKASEFFIKLRYAKENLSCHLGLPTTDEVWPYTQPDNVPYIAFMEHGNKFIAREKSMLLWPYQREIQIKRAEITIKVIKLYDYMDDLKRGYVPLYLKRIRLCQIREALGLDNYDNIKLPSMPPWEYLPPYE